MTAIVHDESACILPSIIKLILLVNCQELKEE
jgi:hypothetical protein